MEERQTGGKADEWGFFNGMNVCSMLRRVRKQRMAGGKRGRTLALLGWRGAREELADFGNPSFISVKPSSAECRLADITELLTAHCLHADCLLDGLHRGPKGPSHSGHRSIKEALSPGPENSGPTLLIPARSQPQCLAQQASCVLAEHRMLP